jgi:hypothetical protein
MNYQRVVWLEISWDVITPQRRAAALATESGKQGPENYVLNSARACTDSKLRRHRSAYTKIRYLRRSVRIPPELWKTMVIVTVGLQTSGYLNVTHATAPAM